MLNFLKNIYHFCLAWLGNVIYGFPSKKIFVLGVTGTKGKSTTIELINAILEATGKKTALLSSVRFKFDKETEKNMTGMTMPGRFFIQKFLRRAVNVGCQYALIEVTSQGILQFRHRFIDFDAAMFLNLQPEHIEAHGSFENYRNAKTQFFKDVAKNCLRKNKFFFINEGDSNHHHFIEAVKNCGQMVYFSREGFIEGELNKGKEKIGDWLSNNFNLENGAAATAFAKSQGIGWPVIKKVFSSFVGVPGRMEVIKSRPFKVVIDYAHTPDSLEKIYQSLSVRNNKSERSAGWRKSNIEHRTSNLICVLGAAGGGRDKWKRPEMGLIASQYCKIAILTNEDPFDENPEEIMDQIEAGFLENPKIKSHPFKILDRKEAIKKAISIAKEGDTVVITGKGSEAWMRVEGGKKIPWNERKITEELLG